MCVACFIFFVITTYRNEDPIGQSHSDTLSIRFQTRVRFISSKEIMWIHPCNSFSFFLFGMKYGDAICCCYLGTGRNSFRRCNRTDTLHERSSMMWTTHGCLHFLHLPLLHYVSYLLLCLSIVYWQMPDNSRVSSVSPPFRIIDCYKDTESGPITLGTFALRALLFFPLFPFLFLFLSFSIILLIRKTII